MSNEKEEEHMPAGIGATRETGFDDDTVKDGRAEFYNGKKGRTDWLEFPNTKVVVADTHFQDGYFQCHRAECCADLS